MLVYLVLFVVFVLICFTLRGEKNPLDDLPGYYKLPLIGNIYIFIGRQQRDIFNFTRENVKKFGNRFLLKYLNLRVLQLSHPADVEVLLSHSQNITKGKLYDFLKPWLGTGLLMSSGKKWFERRKVLTPTFHFDILRNFIKIMNENSKMMVDHLGRIEDDEVDITPVVSEFTLQIICETAMGTQLNKDHSKMAIQYKEAIVVIGNLLFSRATTVWLFLDAIFKKSKVGKKFQECLNIVHAFSDKVINERKENITQSEKNYVAAVEEVGSKKRLALLDLLFEAESKGNIDLEGIKEEVNTFMFEGHDTTAMAITFGIMLLADHENVQERIFEEYMNILGDTNQDPSLGDLAKLKYLEAVIKETLRLYPSVHYISRTITEDFMLNGLLVKKGTDVGVHIYDLHRREDMFPEPNVFNPDRFITGKMKHNFAFVPFSAGPRNCIGQRFAMLEMKCILSKICCNFKLSRRDPGKEPPIISDLVLRPAEPIYVKFLKRDRS